MVSKLVPGDSEAISNKSETEFTFTTTSDMMTPTLPANSTLVFRTHDSTASRTEMLQLNIMILYKNSVSGPNSELNLTENSKRMIGRILALEGDFVELKSGKIIINDKEIKEDYSSNDATWLLESFPKTQIEKGNVFVLPDNRSSDEFLVDLAK